MDPNLNAFIHGLLTAAGDLLHDRSVICVITGPNDKIVGTAHNLVDVRDAPEVLRKVADQLERKAMAAELAEA